MSRGRVGLAYGDGRGGGDLFLWVGEVDVACLQSAQKPMRLRNFVSSERCVIKFMYGTDR